MTRNLNSPNGLQHGIVPGSWYLELTLTSQYSNKEPVQGTRSKVQRSYFGALHSAFRFLIR